MFTLRKKGPAWCTESERSVPEFSSAKSALVAATITSQIKFPAERCECVFVSFGNDSIKVRINRDLIRFTLFAQG